MGSIIKRTQFAIPPLALMILASIEVPDAQQPICDLRFEEFPFNNCWDLVGIGVQTGIVSKAFELADRLRKRGVRVLRQRQIDHLVDEVRRFRCDDKRIFFFVDDSINGDPLFVQELFKRLIPLNIT